MVKAHISCRPIYSDIRFQIISIYNATEIDKIFGGGCPFN